jgi:hypothetical protein
MTDYRDELSAAHDRIAALEREVAARESPPLPPRIVEKRRRSARMTAALRARYGEPPPPAWTVYAAFTFGFADLVWMLVTETTVISACGYIVVFIVLFGYGAFAQLRRGL